MILPNAINNMMYVSIIAIERVFLEKVYIKIRYPYARNEPANNDLNSDAVSKFPAETGTSIKSDKSLLNITKQPIPISKIEEIIKDVLIMNYKIPSTYKAMKNPIKPINNQKYSSLSLFAL